MTSMTDGKVKILYIEDDSLMGRVFERLFRLSGFEIEIITDGEEAIAHLNTATNLPALILLDIMLPRASGLEVVAFLKKNPVLKTIPVVILSNAAGEENAKRALEMGVNLYLIKSEHEPQEIVDKIKEVIQSSATTN